MGKYSDEDRKPRDYYPTPLKATRPLFPFIDTTSNSEQPPVRFIEPCWGDGRLQRDIEEHTDACCVYANDIEPQVDHTAPFLSRHPFKLSYSDTMDLNWKIIAEETQADMFITNPPWLNSKASGFLLNNMIQKLASVLPTWFLLNGNYLWNEKSAPQIEICHTVVPIGRVKWIEDSEHYGKEDCAWFLFDANKSSGNPGPVVFPRYKTRQKV